MKAIKRKGAKKDFDNQGPVNNRIGRRRMTFLILGNDIKSFS